ncbi:MAG: MATE family efflux transporter [Ruminococcaceae bacterium]|nr:MATE family efflux transporter [Oscillospiraceae bacterium]
MFFGKNRDSEILDVTKGPMLKKMILFTIPVILSGILQQAFNTADNVVVGRYAGADALGGVTATASLTNLIICLFIGLSVGASVAISQALGARDEKEANELAHTAIATAIYSGVVVGVVGFIVSKPILELMGTPKENIEYAAKYMKIYFCGAPFVLLYNFGSGILRTMGDTKRPLIYLAIGGIANVILNLVFVIGFGMDTDGVAIATVMSNVIASSLVLYTLIKSDNCCKISPGDIRIDFNRFKRIMVLGIPAGIQSAMFSLSNVVMQSSINFFGSAAVAGNGAALTMEMYGGFVAEGFSSAGMTFAGQNTGAKKYERLKTVFYQANLLGAIMTVILSLIIIPSRHTLVGFFITDSPEAVKIGCERLMWVFSCHFLATVMTVSSGCLKGMGKSFSSMIVSVFGVCVLRVVWIMTIFKLYPTLSVVYAVYPLSWLVTIIALWLIFIVTYKKVVFGRTQLNI